MSMTSGEVWRDIPGYEGRYQASNLGRIRNITSGLVLKPWMQNAGYLSVRLVSGDRKSKKLVHRIVACAFIANPESKPQVNHKNGVKTDNRAENLEWCDNRENALHSAYTLGNESTIEKRRVVCLDNGTEYRSVAEAARDIGGCNQNIVKCCQGKRKHHHGLRWAYVKEVARNG